ELSRLHARRARPLARRGGDADSTRTEDRARQSVLPRQPWLDLSAAGKDRSRRYAAGGRGGEAAEDLGHSGTPGRPAAEAEPPCRSDCRLAAGARRRRRVDRSREDSEED